MATLTREQILASLSAGTPSTSDKSKTTPYKVTMANKNGEMKSIGMINIWARFNDAQQAQIVKKLQDAVDGLSIELYTGETSSTDDEF